MTIVPVRIGTPFKCALTSWFASRSRRIARLMAIAGMLFTAQAALALTAIDDSGAAVSLGAPARRIVSLAPNITEMLFAVGAGAETVGVVEFSDFPPAAREIPRVGNNGLLDMERIVSLRPDLIIVWLHGGYDRQLDQLRSLGVPVFYSEPRTLAEIPRALLALGTLTGNTSQAKAAARAFSDAVENIRARYAGAAPVSVFYQVWDRPLLTINRKHIIADVMRLCGGHNIFSGLPTLVPTVSVEAVVDAAPDAIVTAKAADAVDDGLGQWRTLTKMRAVADHNLIVLDADLISRQGPRIVEGARELCAKLEAVRAKRQK